MPIDTPRAALLPKPPDEGAPSPYGFSPEPCRTAAMSKAVRFALTRSVEQVLVALGAAGAAFHGDFNPWRQAMLANPRPLPQLWALYHDLVQAALDHRPDEATALATELLSRDPGRVGSPGVVTTFSTAGLGRDVARCLAVVDNDPTHPLGLHAVAEEDVDRIRALLVSARGLLGGAAPDLLDEMDVLGHQVLLGIGDRTAFGGAASVFLWGAVVLNPTLVKDRIDLAESLAHETAHALLFGLTLGEDLTTNDPDERFSSPLRADPRPIEGLVHATYVLARMVYALQRLAEAGALDPAERPRVAAKIERNVALYRGGLKTVEAHARLTREGMEILGACRGHMRMYTDGVG